MKWAVKHGDVTGKHYGAAEYRQVFDRTNSSLSHYIENSSYAWADFKYGLGQKEWRQFYLGFRLAGTLNAQRKITGEASSTPFSAASARLSSSRRGPGSGRGTAIMQDWKCG